MLIVIVKKIKYKQTLAKAHCHLVLFGDKN